MDAPTIIETVEAWTPSFNFVAQMSHLFSAAAIVFGLRLLFRWPLLWCLAAVLLWAVPKEFVWDIFVEEDTWTNGWIDLGFYALGGWLSIIAVLLRHWKDLRDADREYEATMRHYWPGSRP